MALTTFPGFSFDLPSNHRDATIYAIAALEPSGTTGFTRNVTFQWHELHKPTLREAIAEFDAYLLRLRMPGLRMGPRGERTVQGLPAYSAQYVHDFATPAGPFKLTTLQLWIIKQSRVLNLTFMDAADTFDATASEREALIDSLQLT